MVVSRANSQRSSHLDYPQHQHEEHQNDQRKRQHHAHTLQIPSLNLLIVCLDVPLAVLRTLSYRPQLAVAVARRRLIQLTLWRLEGVDLCVCVVADPLEALGQARRVLDKLSARMYVGRHAWRVLKVEQECH